MTAINKDHHCRGCYQLPLLSMITAFAAINNKQRPLASGGRHCQLCGSGDGSP
jgi:hypothetical protein